jgi:hypothetical protein
MFQKNLLPPSSPKIEAALSPKYCLLPTELLVTFQSMYFNPETQNHGSLTFMVGSADNVLCRGWQLATDSSSSVLFLASYFGKSVHFG